MAWIEIIGWNRFQHYKNRRPNWIKLYPDLLDNDEYLNLPPGTRLLLIELWMAYAKAGRQVADNTATLSRRLGHKVTKQQLETLNHAGFIRIRASKPLARRYPRSRKERSISSKNSKTVETLELRSLLKDMPQP